MSKSKSAADFLTSAAQTYRAKNKVYGSNYENVGGMVAAMFPNGITLKTAQDHERWHILSLIIVKLSRYAVNWEKGHQDSIHDATVYCAMLEAIDSHGENK